MSEYKMIYARVWNPKAAAWKTKKTERATSRCIKCNNSENCDLFKINKCLRIQTIFGEYCPYSKTENDQGPTQMAKSYNKWVADKKAEYKEVLDSKLEQAPTKMVVVGEYIYIPYSHADMNENVPFMKHDKVFVPGIPLVKKTDFNIQTILNIIDFTPTALTGGEITSYQRKEVPLFILHLSEVFPELYNQLIEKRPELKLKEVIHVGRKALLKTVNPNSTFHKEKEEWFWNGKTLTSTTAKLFLPIIKGEVAITITPDENEIITIESNDQVNENTIFIN